MKNISEGIQNDTAAVNSIKQIICNNKQLLFWMEDRWSKVGLNDTSYHQANQSAREYLLSLVLHNCIVLKNCSFKVVNYLKVHEPSAG